jgi:hypothetical protein
MSRFERRPAKPKPGEGPGERPDDPKFAGSYPATWDWLTQRVYDDGKPRETLTVLVFCEGTQFKACLNDRDGQQSCFVSGSSFAALWRAIEAVFEGGKGDWRPWKQGRR